MQMPKQSTTDVLIVGGGPTGLALGLELAAQGGRIRFRIVDKALGRSDKSRALVIQPRTLELLNRHRHLHLGNSASSGDDISNTGGIGRSLQSRGNTADGTTIVVSGRAVAGFETRDIAPLPNTAFPLQLIVEQQETERVLDESLAKATAATETGGVKVEWGVEARSIVRDGDGEGVTVTLGKTSSRPRGNGSRGGTKGAEDEDGVEEGEEVEIVHAKFVVGCDGKNSRVRQAAGLTFEGDSYAQDFVLADARVKWNDPARNHNRACLCFGHGLLTVIPLGHDDMVRVVAVRASITNTSDQKDNDKDKTPKLEDFQRYFDSEMLPELGGTLHSATWLARFYLHHRGVDRYLDPSSRRLLVAGDAAHVHSPVGGQGMNTGIQDAVNLGWKLGAVLRGERPPRFLDSYDAERTPVGRRLLETTDRAFAWLTWMHPWFLWLRNALLPWVVPRALQDRGRVSRSFWDMSQLGITYYSDRRGGGGGGITGTAEGLDKGCRIRGGDRVLDGKIRAPGEEGDKYLLELTDARTHHLLLFSGVDSQAASEGDLQRAEAKFVENSRIPAQVHGIFGEKPNGQSGYVDVDGILHREFGFKKASYILIRPDGYAAHVGPLSALGALVGWFNESLE
ncbi:hypothetical protein SLS62_004654 [Diatrype stigma]|uniref:FAD-binding domain-containing protein n=1 Tax=Diatrype stigma TaxID=117547 RepID=A0AAN9YT62_9PEZI